MNVKIAIALATLASGFSTLNAQAHNHLNCHAYAKAVIAQVKKNIGLGCGFSGPVWSSDYNFHFNWCNQNTTQIHHLGEQENIRKGQMQQCLAKVKLKDQNHRAKEKACLKYAKKAVKLDAEIRDTCQSNSAWPKDLKTHVQYCMGKGGADKVYIDNVKRTGAIAECRLKEQKDKQAQTKIFPDSGKVSARRKRKLPVDVCLRKFNRDNSWFLGFGGGVVDAPFGHECGKNVATAFCITKGYVEAIEAPVKTYDNGSDVDGKLASTYWIGSKKACHGKCAGFRYIKCKGKL